MSSNIGKSIFRNLCNASGIKLVGKQFGLTSVHCTLFMEQIVEQETNENSWTTEQANVSNTLKLY